MAIINFNNISKSNIAMLETTFSLIKDGKNNGNINHNKIQETIGPLYKSKFWHPTPEELKEWEKRWFGTPHEKRLNDEFLKTPWDFDAWIDALNNAEISFSKLVINAEGSGFLEYEQLASPSGGIEATEEIINIFGGNITKTESL